MQQEDILAFFQNGLERNFGFDDDQVIESLQASMEELRKANLDLPPKGEASEMPQKPFGLFVPPSVEYLIGRRTIETEKELVSGVRRSIRESRPSIPADGGLAVIPTENSSAGPSSPVSVTGAVVAGDGPNSRASIENHQGSPNVSPMEKSASSATDASRQPESRNTLNDAEPIATTSLTHVIEVGPAPQGAPLRPNNIDRESDYDNVNGEYEQNLEQTLENMEMNSTNNVVSYSQGVSVVEVNGYPENTNKMTHQVEMHHFHPEQTQSNHREMSTSRQEYSMQETQFSSSRLNGPMTLPLTGVNGVQNGYVEVNHVSPSGPSPISPAHSTSGRPPRLVSPNAVSSSRRSSGSMSPSGIPVRTFPAHSPPHSMSPTSTSPAPYAITHITSQQQRGHMPPHTNTPTRSPQHGMSPTRSPQHGMSPIRSPQHGMSPTRSPPHRISPTRSPPHGTTPTRNSPTKRSPTRKSPTKPSPTRRTPPAISPVRSPGHMPPTRNAGSPTKSGPRSPDAPPGGQTETTPTGAPVYRSTVYL